jgi:vancomycin permeability regulator SanA
MKKLKIVSLILTLWFLSHQLIIVAEGLTIKPKRSHVAVVLGNKVNQDGTLSKRLQARVDESLKLFNDSLVNKILVSGGLGLEGHFEGQKMADYLVFHGVPKSKVIIDNQGVNTWATAENTRQFFDVNDSIVIVTQFYHYSRCKLAFKRHGFEHITGATPHFFELRDFYSLFREFFGYYSYLLR